MQILHFLQTEGLWQPCVEQAYWRHFSNSICSLHVSVSLFGNSHNISKFFIIIVFVMVICDQWSLMLPFFKNLFIYLVLTVLGLRCCVRAFLVVASGGYSWLQCVGFSLCWPLLLRSTGSRCAGFSSCGTWAQWLWLAGSRAQAQ